MIFFWSYKKTIELEANENERNIMVVFFFSINAHVR